MAPNISIYTNTTLFDIVSLSNFKKGQRRPKIVVSNLFRRLQMGTISWKKTPIWKYFTQMYIWRCSSNIKIIECQQNIWNKVYRMLIKQQNEGSINNCTTPSFINTFSVFVLIALFNPNPNTSWIWCSLEYLNGLLLQYTKWALTGITPFTK